MTNVQGDQAPAERQKMLKNSRTYPQRPSPNNPWVFRPHWDQLWSLPGNLNREFEHALYCSIMTTHLPTHPWKPQSLWLTTWLSFPILPTCQTWSSVISLFPKLKMKLKGRFETVSDIRRELQAVLNSIKKNDFHSTSEACKKWWDRCICSQGDYFEGDGSQNWVT